MRSLLLGALLALLALFLAPCGAAQLMNTVLTIDAVAVQSSPLDPGDSTSVAVTFTRTCPNAASVYTEQAAQVRVVGRGNWTVDGPEQVVFPQQVCAEAMTSSILVTYLVTAPRDAARGEAFPFMAQGQLVPANQATPASNEARFPFTIATSEPLPVAPAADEAVRESPPAGAGLLALGLAAAVLLARRR